MRLATATILLALVLCAFPGCTSTDKEEREPFTPQLWREMQKDDQQRAKSEDQREAEGSFQTLQRAKKKIIETIVGVYNYITGDTPFNAAKDLLDPYFPERRRKAVVYLADQEFGRHEPYTKYYPEMARTDDEYLVRAAAVRALNRARAKNTDLLLIALEDKNEFVRLEAAKSLANMPDPAAISALISHLQGKLEIREGGQIEQVDESIDVRVACADALRSYKNQEAAQALVRMLRDRNFAVAWQSRRSLKLMTGRDYRYDPSAWLTYLSSGQWAVGSGQ